VLIICKKEETELVQSVIEDAKNQFLKLLAEQTNKFKNYDPKITVDKKYNLPEYM